MYVYFLLFSYISRILHTHKIQFSSGGHLKVLVADDYQPNRLLIGKIMAQWGIEPEIVSNGKDAVSLSEQYNYDLCILDINMPVMNGMEATREIRSGHRFLPILGVSGYANKNECLDIGMDDFLMKPYNIEVLHKKIYELTVKTVNIRYKEGCFELYKERPVDSEQLKELKELYKKGLTKLFLNDITHEFVVHKNVQDKIANDLIAKELELSVFLDRSKDKPKICHLHKSSLGITMRCLLPEEFEKLVKEEDKILQNSTEVTYKFKEDKEEYEN